MIPSTRHCWALCKSWSVCELVPVAIHVPSLTCYQLKAIHCTHRRKSLPADTGLARKVPTKITIFTVTGET